MRLVYTADLHGALDSYVALLDLAVVHGAQAVIVGGDLLPHGFSLADSVALQRAFVERELGPLLESFHAAQPGVSIYLLAGNDDWAAAIAAFEPLETGGLAHPLHEHVYDLAPASHQSARGAGQRLWLAGYSCVPPTPFSIKDYERRDDGPLPPFSFGMAYVSWSGATQPVTPAQIAAQPSIAEALAELAGRSDPASTIYVCHTPPAGTPLDLMHGGRHVGSVALRRFIEERGPPLTLHGHIHEAPRLSGQFAVRLGPTWCVNPGNDGTRLHAVTLDTDDIEGTLEHTVYGRWNAQR